MLNLPESIKALFKRDSVLKNFRVHFPNGGFSDITNENIVEESVKFSESLCSQNIFRFGCAEASVLEFETIGVGNMYGKIIEAGIEIDTSSLSAADISTIQAGTWDGTLVLAADSDIGYGFFRVPLGVFRVESCPRNHGAMTHRRVTAYSVDINADSYESFKLKTGSATEKYYHASAEKIIMSALSDTEIAAAGWSKTQITPVMSTSSNVTVQVLIPVYESQPDRIPIYIGGQWHYVVLADITYSTRRCCPGNDGAANGYGVPSDDLFGIDLHTRYTQVYKDASSFISRTVRVKVSDILSLFYKTSLSEYLASKVKDLGACIIAAPKQNGDNSPFNPQYFYITGNMDAFYPYLNNEQIASISIPNIVEINLVGNGDAALGTQTTNYTSQYGSSFKLYKYTTSGANNGISFDTTGQRRTSDGITFVNTFINAYGYKNLAQGLFEAYAEFLKQDRLGGYEVFRLDSSSPQSVSPGDYSDCWWDEYNIAPIGTVVITFLDGNAGEKTSEINIGDGSSVYDMTDNEMLKTLDNASYSSVKTIIDTNFTPYAGAVSFTPVDLTMQGWPWLEAGDALEITAEDGTVVKTYAMRVEMSGIQNLVAAITAQGGQVIEEV